MVPKLLLSLAKQGKNNYERSCSGKPVDPYTTRQAVYDDAAADLYLGDVSSQVYEFIINPRPCLFLNTNGIDYKEDINYRFWQSGLVIDSIKNLDSDLSQAFLSFDEYRPVQEKLNLENYFVQEGSSPSIRAAQAIIKFLNS